MTDTITKAAQALIAAIKIDRHDWEDWPNDSRKAFEALKAAIAAPQPQRTLTDDEIYKVWNDSNEPMLYRVITFARAIWNLRTGGAG